MSKKDLRDLKRIIEIADYSELGEVETNLARIADLATNILERNRG